MDIQGHTVMDQVGGFILPSLKTYKYNNIQ
jgi:hypothetical protein